MLMWLISSLGAHRHIGCKVEPNKKELGMIKKVHLINLTGNATDLTGIYLYKYTILRKGLQQTC